MRVPLIVLAVTGLLVTVDSHGSMYEPPARNSQGFGLLSPTCAGGACQWYSQGSTIGCEVASGGFDHKTCDCEECAEPTLKWGQDDDLLQYHTDGHDPPVDTTYFPWRFPGSSPVLDSCGVTAGGMPPLGQKDPPPGVPAGAKGSDETMAPKLLETTVWIQGTTVEVAWGIAANHGGGYQYRLCPVGQTLDEECFHKIPLEFVGDVQWLQFGQGMDVSSRMEIPAMRVGGDKVVPAGSTWTKAPIPGCMINGAREKKDCLGPTFPPPLATQTFHYSKPSNLYGIFGYGGGHCMGNQSKNENVGCTDQEYAESVFDFGIVDKVKVPDVPPGDYVISFRWDCEQTKQIWSSCGDITIKAPRDGVKGTKPFSPQKGCSACCVPHGMCTRCRDCQDDKTGDCEYCWTPMTWWGPIRSWSPRSHHVQCLGHEADDGGAGSYTPGDAIGLWSPGCTKCWAEEGGCDMHVRDVEDGSSDEVEADEEADQCMESAMDLYDTCDECSQLSKTMCSDMGLRGEEKKDCKRNLKEQKKMCKKAGFAIV